MQLYKCFVWLQNEKVTDANSLREIIISDLLENHLPVVALAFIKTKWVNYGENYFNLFIFHFW
jgi:hypothetical protein